MTGRWKSSIIFRREGFTLIEIMVSLAISGIVLAGVYSVYKMQHKSYVVQEQVANMQQSERIALQMIARDIRFAGLGLSCSEGGIILTEDFNGNGVLNGGEDINGNGVLNTFGNGLGYDGSDTIALAYYTFSPDNRNGGVAKTAENFNTASATFQVDDAAGFSDENGENLIMIYETNDPCHYAIVKATNVDIPSATITHAAGKAIENLPNGAGSGFSSGDRVKRVNTAGEGGIITYAINDSYVLTRSINGGTGQPLADNIEDMQIAYGFDKDNNGAVEAWVHSPAGEDMSRLREIRATMVARTIRNDPEWKAGARPQVEDHNPATTAAEAQYRRRILRSTIKLRNIDNIMAKF